MRGFVGFTKRNLMLYFKDKQSIFFSLLTSIIVLVLYLLFLRGTFVDAIESSMKGLEMLVDRQDLDMLANGLLLVGVLGSAMITVPYNCLSFMVADKERNIDYDIAATPLKRWQIVVSYFLSSVMSAYVMSAAILTVGLVLLRRQGDLYLTAGNVAGIFGAVLLGVISSTALFMLVLLFFRTTAASSAFSGLLSAASGFVIGAYIPVSQFSEAVQSFCNIFPASHVTALYRNTLLNGVLDHMDDAIGGLDQGQFCEAMRHVFSFKSLLFGHSFTSVESICYAAAVMLVCMILMVVVYSKTYKRK